MVWFDCQWQCFNACNSSDKCKFIMLLFYRYTNTWRKLLYESKLYRFSFSKGNISPLAEDLHFISNWITEFYMIELVWGGVICCLHINFFLANICSFLYMFCVCKMIVTCEPKALDNFIVFDTFIVITGRENWDTLNVRGNRKRRQLIKQLGSWWCKH